MKVYLNCHVSECKTAKVNVSYCILAVDNDISSPIDVSAKATLFGGFTPNRVYLHAVLIVVMTARPSR